MPPLRPNDAVRLTDEQEQVVAILRKLPTRVMTLGGFAGTGKTTVIKVLKKHLHLFAVCAYTGKAANVLRRKGVDASTIHSLIYKPEEVKKWVETPDGKGRWIRSIRYVPKARSEVPFEGFVVDEASMVSKDIYADLLAFGVPVIFVGDHGQLEPVQGKGFCVMKNPDLRLETIHRNAGEIAHFAQFVREGNPPKDWATHPDHTGGQVRILPGNVRDETWARALLADQIICGLNRTRVQMNRLIRSARELPPDRPEVGDRVMCLQNDRTKGLYNGQQGTILDLSPGDVMVFSAAGVDTTVVYLPEAFGREKHGLEWSRDVIPFDYAYCVTCHKAQGDEWDEVTVIEERCGSNDPARWCYTAASRARKKLVWVAP